jgi:hypothetical protein
MAELEFHDNEVVETLHIHPMQSFILLYGKFGY